MIRPVPALAPPERVAAAETVARAIDASRDGIVAALLFGSKARGDADEDSDVDLLLICRGDMDDADTLAAGLAQAAGELEAGLGVSIEPWVVPAMNLREGRRTPMLVDALHDGLPLWPPDAPPLRLPFTPADARFCADCLLDWVAEGGGVVRTALDEGRLADAAARARDDITRLATAALLLTGDTRHRRSGTLRRFRRRLVRTGEVDPAVRPAVAWALRAFPVDDGRGRDHAPVPPAAAADAARGYRLAAVTERSMVPWILERMENAWDDASGAGRPRAVPAARRGPR